MNIHWKSNITNSLWIKFAINCAINALTVIYNCRNGELLSEPAAANELVGLCAEIQSILTSVAECPSPLNLYQKVETVLQATAQNYSSTLQDVRNGRPSEIDYLNQHLVELAKSANLESPINNSVLRRFRCIAGTTRH